MRLIFIHGPAAAGKLTVARELAALTGYALFHNHLVVDAVAALFPFGTPSFVRLRERLWLTLLEEAANAGRSTIFTFAPEPTVAEDFPRRLREMVEAAGGEVILVRLTLPVAEQERRLGDPSRQAFGKLTSLDLLRELRPQFEASEARMPPSALTLDTAMLSPAEAARTIGARLSP